MKITFFAIFDPTWTYILASKDSNIEFLKQYFNFQSIRKTEAIFLGLTCAKKDRPDRRPKCKTAFFAEITKQIISFQKLFISSKYHMF